MVDRPDVEVDPQGELRKTFEKIQYRVTDLSLPLNLIAQQWFKSNRAIFDLVGPGKYAPFKHEVRASSLGAKAGDYRKRRQQYTEEHSLYQVWKIKHFGFDYPLLKATGKLERSITDPTDGDAVNYILNRLVLVLGTRVSVTKTGAPYAWYLHHGTKHMVARPVVLFGNEQVAPGALNQRVSQWKKILLDYVMRTSEGP